MMDNKGVVSNITIISCYWHDVKWYNKNHTGVIIYYYITNPNNVLKKEEKSSNLPYICNWKWFFPSPGCTLMIPVTSKPKHFCWKSYGKFGSSGGALPIDSPDFFGKLSTGQLQRCRWGLGGGKGTHQTWSWLVGGWTNPFEKYARQNGWLSSPNRDEHLNNMWNHRIILRCCFLHLLWWYTSRLKLTARLNENKHFV